jgi:hypothetical protein
VFVRLASENTQEIPGKAAGYRQTKSPHPKKEKGAKQTQSHFRNTRRHLAHDQTDRRQSRGERPAKVIRLSFDACSPASAAGSFLDRALFMCTENVTENVTASILHKWLFINDLSGRAFRGQKQRGRRPSLSRRLSCSRKTASAKGAPLRVVDLPNPPRQRVAPN